MEGICDEKTLKETIAKTTELIDTFLSTSDYNKYEDIVSEYIKQNNFFISNIITHKDECTKSQPVQLLLYAVSNLICGLLHCRILRNGNVQNDSDVEDIKAMVELCLRMFRLNLKSCLFIEYKIWE